MAKSVRETIKEITRTHLTERNGLCFGQCLTAVGWVGGTLPELYEENNEIPNVYNNILDTKTQDKSKNTPFRLKRSQTKQTKSNALSSTFNL